MRDTLICTVGTSLKNNINGQKESPLYSLLMEGNAKGVALELLKNSPEDRLNGAEINSIHSIISGKRLDRLENLVLLVSHTPDGDLTGSILSHVYDNPRNAERFAAVSVKAIAGLTDQDVKRFRNEGLRNLVRLIGQEARLKGSERLLINATGGYKAQISFAGMIGQALEIPVCYLFERFSEVIELPPQPVSLDLTFWLDHVELFFDLEEGIETDTPFNLPDERFATIVDEVQVENLWLSNLSPTGQLFHETFRHRFALSSSTILPPDSGISPETKKIHYEDDNRGKHKGLEIFLNKIRKLPYVTEIYTHYFNPRLNVPIRFRKSAKDPRCRVEGVFSNAGATTKFDITTNAKNSRQLQSCIADLSDKLAT
ncbi:MAG: CRISPR-associated protein (Cas_APE2256) [Syntrophus sp. PtaU1.Bin208]|nr:MAG: CRISPR-associated protein (Cas_APE2256) [Syntrophus sp. PtaU1.Bin208]